MQLDRGLLVRLDAGVGLGNIIGALKCWNVQSMQMASVETGHPVRKSILDWGIIS